MKKGIAPIGIAIIAIVAVVVGLVVFTPGAIASISYIITGQLPNCNEGPFISECFCEFGVERKITSSYAGIPIAHCEVLEDLLLDPESSTFDDDAIAFTLEYLDRYCGNICTELQCADLVTCYIKNPDGTYSINTERPNPDKPYCIEATWGVTSTGERKVNIECSEVTSWSNLGPCNADSTCTSIWGVCYEGTCYRKASGVIPWRMNFFVESDTGIPKTSSAGNNYCVDPDRIERCEPPIENIGFSTPLSIIGFE